MVGSAKRGPRHVEVLLCQTELEEANGCTVLGRDQRGKFYTTSCWIHEKYDRFRSASGSLVYLSADRLDIAFSVTECARGVSEQKKNDTKSWPRKLLDTLRRIDAWCGGSITQTNPEKSMVTLASTMEDARTHIATRAAV